MQRRPPPDNVSSKANQRDEAVTLLKAYAAIKFDECFGVAVPADFRERWLKVFNDKSAQEKEARACAHLFRKYAVGTARAKCEAFLRGLGVDPSNPMWPLCRWARLTPMTKELALFMAEHPDEPFRLNVEKQLSRRPGDVRRLPDVTDLIGFAIDMFGDLWVGATGWDLGDSLAADGKRLLPSAESAPPPTGCGICPLENPALATIATSCTFTGRLLKNDGQRYTMVQPTNADLAAIILTIDTALGVSAWKPDLRVASVFRHFVRRVAEARKTHGDPVDPDLLRKPGQHPLLP
jgi:hypothetical protein